MQHLSSTIKFFCEWIEDKYTEFTNIDLSFKSRLDPETEREIDEVFTRYHGNVTALCNCNYLVVFCIHY